MEGLERQKGARERVETYVHRAGTEDRKRDRVRETEDTSQGHGGRQRTLVSRRGRMTTITTTDDHGAGCERLNDGNKGNRLQHSWQWTTMIVATTSQTLGELEREGVIGGWRARFWESKEVEGGFKMGSTKLDQCNVLTGHRCE